jgi:hypothetical protein
VHDIADLERRGIPGVFVASAVFQQAAEAQSASLGVTPASVFVAHPIQDRTDDEMKMLASAAITALLGAIQKQTN